MMNNVLSDILCDTASLMAPSFKGTLSQNKMLSHDMSSKQGSLILDSVSQISNLNRPLSSVNHSSPSDISIFNSTDQIHIPSNIDSGFEDRNSISVFSDSFPEIVPSWLAHDFMKVSDNLTSPNILSNVSDIYAANGENEHLEMLDLGFTSELTSQDISNNINRTCIDDSQKLLANLPMQRFSNSEPLILPFNSINNTHMHISMDKNNMQYGKFKQNGTDVNSAQSLINAVLPTENDLLHLPLPSNLSEQCLNSTSSPSMVSNSQSQSHPVDVVCDKLPQINFNHLDSFLENETTLSEIQLLRHNFPNVQLNDDSCNTHSNRACLDSYNPNGGIISCDTSNILGPNVTSLSQSQDVSVQVSVNSVNVLHETNLSISGNCYSCNEVPSESPIEVVQCFKCKFCDFVSIHKCAVASHINIMHSKPPDNANISKSVPNNVRSDNLNSLSVGGQSETHFNNNNNNNNNNNIIQSNHKSISNSNNNTILISEGNINSNNNRFSCVQCNVTFANTNEFNAHLLSNHNKTNVQLNSPNNLTIDYQNIPVNNVVKNVLSQKVNMNFFINDISNIQQNEPNKIIKRKLCPKKVEPEKKDPVNNVVKNVLSDKDNMNTFTNDISVMPHNDLNKTTKRKWLKYPEEGQKKDQSKKTLNESSIANNEKNISSHKKAWQKKMRRELGSYICEAKGCNVRFRALDNLEYHRKCHTSGKTFQCPECRMDFEKWEAIAGHLWRNHKNDMELHACDQCPFRTFSLSRLENIHKLIHKDECLFLCDTCGKSFKNGKQLRNHRVIHQKSKNPKVPGNFKCDICSNTFSTKHFLYKHQNIIHNKMKPYSCNFCDYAASKKSTVDLHMRQHTGEKPFKCDLCDYKTSDHNSLRRHKMTHSGDKKYKCPYCSYSCIQAYWYKKHLKRRHPDGEDGLMFSCTVCDFKTLKLDTYLIHISDHESRNNSPNESTMPDMQSTEESFPLAEAMDISLSQNDNLSNVNKNKNILSLFLMN